MRRLSRNILWNLGGQVVLSILAVLAIRLVFKRLGPDVVGIILFTQTLNLVLISLLELGVVVITVREVAAHLGSDRAYVQALLRTAAVFYWSAYLVLLIALLVAAPIAVRDWIHVTTLSSARAIDLVRILGAGSLLLLPRALYASVFRGLQRMPIVNIVEVGAIGVQQAGILLILGAGGGALLVAWWIAAGYLLSLLAYMALTVRVLGLSSLVPRPSSAVIRRNFRFSTNMIAISTLGTLHSQSDKLAMSKLMPVDVLGVYGFASTLVAGVGRVTLSIAQAAFPSFASLSGEREPAAVLNQYRVLQTIVVYGTAPFFAGMAFLSLPVFSFVFNHAVAESLVLPVVLLCLGFYMNGLMTIPYYLALALGRPGIAAKLNLLAVPVVLPAVVVLVATLGMVGAALSWVFYHVFAFTYAVPRISRECLRAPVHRWYAQAATAGAIVALSYGLGAGVLWLSGAVTTASLIAVYGVASLLYGALAYGVAWKRLRSEWLHAAAPSRVEADAA